MRRRNTLPVHLPKSGAEPGLAHEKVSGPRLPTIILAGMTAIGSGLYVAHLHSERFELEKVARGHDAATELLHDERDRLHAETARLQTRVKALGARLDHRDKIVNDLDRRRRDLEEKNLALLEKQTKAQQERTAFGDGLSTVQSDLAQLQNDGQSLEERLAAALDRIERERVLRSELVTALADHEDAYRDQSAALASAKQDKLQAEATIVRLRKELDALGLGGSGVDLSIVERDSDATAAQGSREPAQE